EFIKRLSDCLNLSDVHNCSECFLAHSHDIPCQNFDANLPEISCSYHSNASDFVGVLWISAALPDNLRLETVQFVFFTATYAIISTSSHPMPGERGWPLLAF
ncbi:34612_t:CDS:2, partial [Racocetra persica]